MSKNETTRPATQVGLRPVESGLGGHDDGVSGDDAGVENASIPLWKRGRLALSVSLTISVFASAERYFQYGSKLYRWKKPIRRHQSVIIMMSVPRGDVSTN